ncbi:MAG: DEAD/DEAH box helicase [Candidatus Eisenbacteria bacterium]|nr:DEAD/DEAH box helicase [Candidatus Eisenbacteria bacterium]
MRRAMRQLEEILGTDGLLAKVIEAYDWRPQQLELGRATLESLLRERILLAEAPTGVGKTLAYLVPAALYARAEGEPVVVSSYTKALQNQILEQEAPRLRRLVHPDLQIALLKGRSNYLCRRRWELFLAEEGAGPDGHAASERLQDWVFTTTSGDFSEAPPLGARAGWVQARIGGEARFCRSRLCRAESGCFHKRARREARRADILVVNHSLLLADALSPGLLPDHRAAIIDEAHLLPAAAIEPFSRELSETGLLRAVRAIGGAGEPGATDRMRRLLRSLPGEVAQRNLTPRLRALEGETRDCLERARAFFEELRDSPLYPPHGERRRCLPQDVDRLLPEQTDRFLLALTTLCRAAEGSATELLAALPPGDLPEELSSLAEVIEGQVAELLEQSETLQLLLAAQPDDRVHILADSPARGAVLGALPLRTGPELREHLLSRYGGLTLTSATLATGRDLRFFAREVGLEPGEAQELRLESPFPLEQQLRVLAAGFMPDPRDPAYEAQLARILAALLDRVPRKALALFTAHRTLERVYEQLLGANGEGRAWELIAQLRGSSKSQLGARFRNAPRALLLGTASFWYGVDFPGDELEIVVITRLPFAVPSDPRVEALGQQLAEEGRSYFREYALPEAVLRFRQGLGRLIRRPADRGVCVVLDPRFVRARYAKEFETVLPVPRAVVDSPAELLAETERWFRAAGERSDEKGGEQG